MKNYNENYIKEAAYYNWQNAGCPSGQDEYFWNMAITQLYGTSGKSSCKSGNSSKSCCKSSASKTCSSSKTTSAKSSSSKKSTTTSKK